MSRKARERYVNAYFGVMHVFSVCTLLVKNGIAVSDLNEFIINKSLFAGDTYIWVKTQLNINWS